MAKKTVLTVVDPSTVILSDTAKVVRAETLKAYADCNGEPEGLTPAQWDKWVNERMKERNLNFLASADVTRNEAFAILSEAVPSYNEFRPKLLLELPADCKIRIAREGSACVYVLGKRLTAKGLKADEFTRKVSYSKSLLESDSEYYKNKAVVSGKGYARYWWD